MTASATLDQLELPAFVSTEEARLLMPVKLYELHRITLGQAAAMIGYSNRGFMDVLGQMSVPVVDYPADELASAIAW